MSALLTSARIQIQYQIQFVWLFGHPNNLLCVSGAQLGVDIVYLMCVQLRMASWGFTMFWSGYILGEQLFLETFWISFLLTAPTQPS